MTDANRSAKKRSTPTDRQRIQRLERKVKHLESLVDALAGNVNHYSRQINDIDNALYELKWGPQ